MSVCLCFLQKCVKIVDVDAANSLSSLHYTISEVYLCVFCSGFNLAPVSRLRSTWERLPGKYEKLLAELQDVFDPSRNMAKYRNLLNKHNLQPPVIPLFPVIKKDLTFLHEGNLRFSVSVA